MALDIDKEFDARLPIIADVLKEIGFDGAAFATPGSAPGKGKVIITLASLVRTTFAREAIGAIYRRVQAAAPALFPATPRDGDVELYPKGGTGGVLRVLGRNAARLGPIELPLSLDATTFLDLDGVIPLTQYRFERFVLPIRVSSQRPASWIRKLTEQSWDPKSLGGHPGIHSSLIAVARYFIDSDGEMKGRARYEEALRGIIIRSPLLETYDSGRNPVRRELEELSAFYYAASMPRCWKSLNLPDAPGFKVYAALSRFVLTNCLRPHCFGIDIRRIAALIDRAKSAAEQLLGTAERSRLVVTLDPGMPNKNLAKDRFEAGSCAIYGLVGEGETPYDVIADANADEMLKKRRELRKKLGIPLIRPEAFYFASDLMRIGHSAEEGGAL